MRLPVKSEESKRKEGGLGANGFAASDEGITVDNTESGVYAIYFFDGLLNDRMIHNLLGDPYLPLYRNDIPHFYGDAAASNLPSGSLALLGAGV